MPGSASTATQAGPNKSSDDGEQARPLVSQLTYATVDSCDLDRWETFAIDVLGMSVHRRTGDLLLKMDELSYRFRIRSGSRDGLAALGWLATEDWPLGAIEEELSALEREITHLKPEECERRGVSAGLSFRDERGIVHEIVDHVQEKDGAFEGTGDVSGFVTGDAGMGHAVFIVANVEESDRFFRGAFGMTLREDIVTQVGSRGLFFGCNPRHHTIAVVETGDPPSVMHLMVEMTEIDDVGCALDRAWEAGWDPRTPLGRHRTDHMISFYVPTPGGFDMEIGCDGLRVTDEATWWSTKESRRKRAWGHIGVKTQVRRGGTETART